MPHLRTEPNIIDADSKELHQQYLAPGLPHEYYSRGEDYFGRGPSIQTAMDCLERFSSVYGKQSPVQNHSFHTRPKCTYLKKRGCDRGRGVLFITREDACVSDFD